LHAAYNMVNCIAERVHGMTRKGSDSSDTVSTKSCMTQRSEPFPSEYQKEPCE